MGWIFALMDIPVVFAFALTLPLWVVFMYPTVWVGLLGFLLMTGLVLVISIPVWVASSPILLLLTPLLVIVGPLMLLATTFVFFLAPAFIGLIGYLFVLGGDIVLGGAAAAFGF